MKITPEQVCEALDAWVCRPGMTQEQATILITEAFWALKERPNIDVQRVTFNDGEVDQRALGVNRVKIFERWKAIDTRDKREKFTALIPAIMEATVADVMSALHASYDDGQSGEKFLRELCEVDLLILDEIGIQRETKNEQVVLHQIVDRRTASMRSVGMLTNLNYEAMKTLLGERIMDRMTMNGGRWVNFNWESWRPNVGQPGIEK